MIELEHNMTLRLKAALFVFNYFDQICMTATVFGALFFLAWILRRKGNCS